MAERRITVKVNQGEEYKIRRGCVYEADSIFFESYRQGAEIIKEILSSVAGLRADYDKTERCGYGIEDDGEYEFPNNFIAFCGGRGEGKSSALRTFAHALEKLHQSSDGKERDGEASFWGDRVLRAGFSVLPVVDPTMMREQDSFMRIILSRMFAQFNGRFDLYRYDEYAGGRQSECGSGRRTVKDHEISTDTKQKILKEFSDCYAYLDTLAKGPDLENRYDDMEEISDLGDSGNLKNKFRQLVRDYLAAMNKGQGIADGDRYLVIQIDDADLNFKKAFGILEDIRSFCMVPEVIILIAADMEQLCQVIEQHYAHDFEILLKYGSAGGGKMPLGMDDCHSMAVRYIDKVIPGSRQIYLPKIDSVIKNDFSDLTVKYLFPVEKESIKEKDILSLSDDFPQDYQEKLLRWIHVKTGITLMKPDSYMHNILPGRFRDLTHFLSYFGKMEDLDERYGLAKIHSLLRPGKKEEETQILQEKRREAGKARDRWLRNLHLFEQYFIKNWAEMSLSREDRDMLLELADSVDTKNASMIADVCDRVSERLGAAEIERDAPQEENSFGLIMKRITGLRESAHKEEDYHLLYALRLYYTMYVYKRLLAFAGDDAAYARIMETCGLFSPWLPDCSQGGEHINYARFEVDLRVLCRLRGEFSEEMGRDSLLRLISPIFYIVRDSGKEKTAQRIRSGDLENILKKDQQDNPGIHVMFDMSYMLLHLVCGQTVLYQLPDAWEGGSLKRWEMTTDFAEILFRILLNWDVQHFLEKRGFPFVGQLRPEPADMERWIVSSLKNAIGRLAENTYLKWDPSVSCFNVHDNGDEAFWDGVMPTGLMPILFGNVEWSRKTLSRLRDNLSAKKREIQSRRSVNGTDKNAVARDILNLLYSEPKEIYDCLPLKEAGERREKILQNWDERLNADRMSGQYSDPGAADQVIGEFNKLAAFVEDSLNEEKLGILLGEKKTVKHQAATAS